MEAAARQAFSCHDFLVSASLPIRTLKVRKKPASMLCFHMGAKKLRKKSIKCQIYTPKAGHKMLRDVVDLLHRFLFTQTSLKGFV